MGQEHLAAQIQQQLDAHEDIHAVIAEQDGKLLLSGTADSAHARAKATQIVAGMAPASHIVNNLAVEHLLPVASQGNNTPASDALDQNDDIPISVAGEEWAREGIIYDPSSTRVPLETEESHVVDPDVVDDLPPVEPDAAYFAPTDPVISIGDHQTLQVDGGFAPSADATIPVAPSSEDDQPGDEALAEAIRRELHEDAATTDLNVHVEVNEGVAFLRGTVSDLEDAENAEEVAGRVPGVIDVVDDLDLAEM